MRKTGKPRVESVEWDCCGGDGTLVVHSDHVASAFVWLNGVLLLQPADFSAHSASFEVPVALAQGANLLTVEVRGRPGSRLELTVTH